MIVVGDASVFIALQRIDELLLLPQLFGEVHVPDAVWREVFSAHPAASMLDSPAWIVRHGIVRVVIPDPQLDLLDSGEAEAIQLAQTLHADLLLIDEAAGRRVAIQRGLNVTGVVGVLIEARRRGEIRELQPCLVRLRAAGFWLNDALIETALRLAGENP